MTEMQQYLVLLAVARNIGNLILYQLANLKNYPTLTASAMSSEFVQSETMLEFALNLH